MQAGRGGGKMPGRARPRVRFIRKRRIRRTGRWQRTVAIDLGSSRGLDSSYDHSDLLDILPPNA